MWGTEMMQGYDWRNVQFFASFQNIPIMIDCGFVELSFLWLDSGPFDGESISIQTKLGKQCDILPVKTIMVYGIARGLLVQRPFHILHEPKIRMFIIPFDLMSCCRCSPEEIGWKL
jgi:hypothetical protein